MRLLRSLLTMVAVLAPLSLSAQVPAVSSVPKTGYAGTTACLDCHKKEAGPFTQTGMGQLFTAHPRTDQEKVGCESCHGPGKQHAESGGDELGGLITFGRKSKTSVTARNASCVSCHQNSARLQWTGSQHESRNVGCTDCHAVMHETSERSSLKKQTVLETCASCHQQRKAQTLRSGHMPLGEKKMECTSCHNPHGSANPKLLLASSTNETCFSCHADKRGPFMWEHPPVVENCANCHDPHGSNQPKMLKISRPRLCQQCHGGASGHPTGPKSLAVTGDLVMLLNRQCANCHVDIHGSNHVSGKYFTR
jgi:DmsE family decaheme c-type cytochrome